MQKIKVNEIFGPSGYWDYVLQDDGTLQSKYVDRPGVTQGEGVFVGQRSTFCRTYSCNLRCPGFGLPHGEKTTEPDEFVKNIGLYKSVSTLPVAQYGCDSWSSWHPGAKHLSPMLTTGELAAQILEASDGSFFKFPVNPTHLIFTGGEPLLGWQRAYVELVEEIRKQDPVWSKHPELILPVTFETNGTQHLIADKKTGTIFLEDLVSLCDITWSISAKLSPSGHTAEEAIKPDVVAEYLSIAHKAAYFKFVIQSPIDLDEVDDVVLQYSNAGVDIPVYIMAEGGTASEYHKHSTVELVGEAVKRGYNITPRLQVLIGDNSQSW